jgi:hypothetical protein
MIFIESRLCKRSALEVAAGRLVIPHYASLTTSNTLGSLEITEHIPVRVTLPTHLYRVIMFTKIDYLGDSRDPIVTQAR